MTRHEHAVGCVVYRRTVLKTAVICTIIMGSAGCVRAIDGAFTGFMGQSVVSTVVDAVSWTLVRTSDADVARCFTCKSWHEPLFGQNHRGAIAVVIVA